MLELASRMAEFIHDTDPYGYKEAYETADEAINEALEMLNTAPEVLLNYVYCYIHDHKYDEANSDNVDEAYEIAKDIIECRRIEG